MGSNQEFGSKTVNLTLVNESSGAARGIAVMPKNTADPRQGRIRYSSIIKRVHIGKTVVIQR